MSVNVFANQNANQAAVFSMQPKKLPSPDLTRLPEMNPFAQSIVSDRFEMSSNLVFKS